MFLMIDGELLNLANVTAVTPIESHGCIVQFNGGEARTYKAVTPETFAKAITSGDLVHFVED